MIHPTAIVHPKAQLDSTVKVGPYAVIDEQVSLGANCVVGPHVYITGLTRIGTNNHFHAGCIIGDAPQDLKYHGEPTELRIGDNNVFREHFTAHRSNKPGTQTVIGSHNFLMINAHVAHNCVIGDHVILANGALLAGHVEVHDRVFISGNTVVHQFCRIGTLAILQGVSGFGMDVPPFVIGARRNEICGLNTIGLRRAGMSSGQRLELKQLYHSLFRSGKNLRDAVTEARGEFSSEPARVLLDFVASSKRGICRDAGGNEESTDD